jgi:branched-chain amino acid aminotransferase
LLTINKVFHYGQAIFEGIKLQGYDDAVWLFLDLMKTTSFNKSAVRMAMPEVPEEIFMNGLNQLLQLDEAWIKKGKGNAMYIKHL